MKTQNLFDLVLTAAKIKLMHLKLLKNNLKNKFKNENRKLNYYQIALLLLKGLIENTQVRIHL